MATKSSEKIQDLAKKVLANAAKAKIVLTPEAYALWYEYYLGDNEKLVADIDGELSSGKAFTIEVNASLYKKHFGTSEKNKAVAKVHDETQIIIQNIFADLITANKNTAQFGGRLGGYAEKLKTVNKMEDIHQIMKAMMQDTNSMAHSSKNLEEKLKEATKQTELLKKKLQKTEKEASVDSLTGLHNRKAFDTKIQQLFDEYKKSKTYFSAIFVDIDFFKKFNDNYGHKVGDIVLQSVGSILHKGVKGSDFPARYGGEEFVILLPATALEQAKMVAEQLRILISVKKPKNPETGEAYDKITASLGVSQVKPEDTIMSVVERADKALYLAKDSGRNNVKTEQDLS
jgi:diguanylate cyclase